MNKKVFGVLSTAFLLGGLLSGCGDAEVKEVSSSGDKQTDESNKKEEAAKTEYKVGETVSIDGMEVTIKSLSWGKPIDGVPVEKGKILRIEVSAKNNSSDNGFVDSSEFQVYDKDGNKLEMYFGNNDANMFGGELKKGKQSAGALEFDVPETETYEIYYEPSFTFKENAEVKWIVPTGEIK
ncbi:DUF4352 domain-containing protein [Metabacillus dongyingensis]|uniref:DUF4352 domain-containing protein n=1 Tax=Metabacillus dongyingensis TaxID=2874282 RepID=UPI003B8CF8E0